MKNKLPGHIKPFSIHIMFFQSHYGRKVNFFEELYSFCGNNRPLSNFILKAPYILNTTCLIDDKNSWK